MLISETVHYELRSARGRPVHTFDDVARADEFREARPDLKLRLFRVTKTEEELGE